MGSMNTYRPSELDKALGVFRDILALLDRFGRSWYSEELRARAQNALRVLSQRAGQIHFSDLASDMPDRSNDLYVKHQDADRLKVNRAYERVYLAVRSAIRSEEPLPRRLLGCYLELHSLDRQGQLPSKLQKRFDAMSKALTERPDPTGERWVVAATLETMGNDEVRKWMDETLNLLVEVIKCQALAELD